MRGRRRSGNYRGVQRRQTRLDFTPVVIILCLAVGCGYATAKYVVDPVVNYVPELLAGQTEKDAKGTDTEKKEDTEGAEEDGKNNTNEGQEESSEAEPETDAVVEDEVEVKEKGEIKGYALQFGCYSSQKAAETAMKSLTVEGLQIIEQDSMFKITGKLYETKEEAKGALQKMEEDTGAFVTTIYK